MKSMHANDAPRCLTCPIRPETVFSDCPEDLLAAVEAVKRFRLVDKGESLFENGETVDAISCQYAGIFGLLRRSSAGDEHLISTTSVGHALGAKDLLQEARHEYSAVALEESAVCTIPAGLFRSLIGDYPPIIVRIMQGVCEKLTQIEKRIELHEGTRS
jgi:CRP-like cAMP-binding protein